jgi:flagellar biosynthetic protein FlhB
MEESETDKTEQPTPFKLDRSRKKGVVARGADLGFMAGLTAAFAYFSIAGSQMSDAIARAARDAWVAGPALADDRSALVSTIAAILLVVVRPVLLLMGLVFACVLLVEFLQTGGVLSAQPLMPDFSRLNPANGLKRVFSVRALIETGKNILKMLIYASLAVMTVVAVARSAGGTIADARGLLMALRHEALRLVAAFVLAAMFFAVLDQIIARATFTQRMRMSRRELRREMRDREGEPRLKQRRKQLHRELAKATKSLRSIRKADVLITNPEHIALALRYESKSMIAPAVVSIGINHMAQRMKRMAFFYSIPIIQNPRLAQAIYRKAVLDGVIPQECYQPVADIYNALRARKGGSHE